MIDRSSTDSSSKGSVLIVDDDPDFVTQLTQILVDRGYSVLSATDGKAASEIVERHHQNIALVMVDLFMPGANGFEFIGLLKRHQLNLKIIAISAARQKILDTAFGLGADATVKKPEAGTRLNVQQWLDAVFLAVGVPNS